MAIIREIIELTDENYMNFAFICVVNPYRTNVENRVSS